MIRTILAAIALSASTALATPYYGGGDGYALAHYERLPRAERVAIEYDLIWIGAVNFVSNGVIGRESLQAIRAFEHSLRRGYPDGVLDHRERRRLARLAERARIEAGYRETVDAATGIGLGLPLAYLGAPRPSAHGSFYEGPRVSVETFAIRQGLRETYRATLAKPGRRVTYKVLRDGFFVIAGHEGHRRFYTRAAARGGDLRAYTIRYDAGLSHVMEPVVVAMSNDMRPFAATPTPGYGRGHGQGTDKGYVPDYSDGHARREPVPEPEYTGPGSIERDYAGPGTADGPCGDVITVPAGDTLFKIARRCGTTVEALRAANGWLDPRALRAGQRLVIPGRDYAYEAPRPAPPSYEAPSAGGVPAVALRPRVLTEGGTATLVATGFAPRAVLEVAFAGPRGRFLTERVVLADASGTARVTLPVPGRFRAGEAVSLAVLSDDGSARAEAGPFVLRAAEQGPLAMR